VTGSFVTVTATANSGYTFTNWTENGLVQSATTSYTFTLVTNRNLVANFTTNPTTNTVAVAASPAQAGSVSGGGSFVTGSFVTVATTANSGYTFTNWTENGTVQSVTASYTFTLATNRNLVANFTTNPTTNTVAVAANPAQAGNVSGGGSFVKGSSVTVAATANSGYTFTNWTENGTVQSATASYTFPLATNRNLVANFTTDSTNTAVVEANPPKWGGVKGGGAFVTGSSVTVTAAANRGYKFVNWMQNGKVQSTSSNYTFTLATNRILVANFTTIPTRTVAIAASPAQAGNVSGGGSLIAGSAVTVTAAPVSGYTFTNWTENGTVQSVSPAYTFNVAADRNLVAHFITNRIIPVAGIYQGLFYLTNNLTPESSGACNVTVGSNGTYTAKIQLGGQSYNFAGQFSPAGQSSNFIARTGSSPLTVELQVGPPNGGLTGQVDSGNWTAGLVTDPVPYSKAAPAPQAGKYTLVIPGVDNSTTQPGGDGYGSATVDSAGNVSCSGVLADGTSFTTAAMITGSGQWPFYASLYGGKGSIIGWLTFATNGDLGGQLEWFKEAQSTVKYYPAGFTNSPAAVGSVYAYSNGAPALAFANGQIVLTGGNLPESLTHQIEMEAKGQITDLTKGKVAFSLTTSSGVLRGSVLDGQTGKAVSVNMIVLQNQQIAAGFFLGSSQSGRAVVTQAP
jgi:hypothetical protein